MTTRLPTCIALLAASGSVPAHELSCHEAIGQSLSRLMNIPFIGRHEPGQGERAYYIPSDTLTNLSEAAALGIHSEADLFGGVVSEPYMAGKAISHPLFPGTSKRPSGWAEALHELAGDSVLPGFSAFCVEDARTAGRYLLETGSIRIKPVRAKAGRGQVVIHDVQELGDALRQLDEGELETWGLVVESNLTEVATYSVGQVRAAGLVASYCGTQNLTPDATGQMVYGGSDLYVVRGEYEALLKHPAARSYQLAIEQARQYEAAALQALPSLILSRRNYDVATGLDTQGNRVSGVLEQSWRIGGASGAEIAALEAFAADPSLTFVEASTIERYGDEQAVPAGTSVVYSGNDEETGQITKYTRIQGHERR